MFLSREQVENRSNHSGRQICCYKSSQFPKNLPYSYVSLENQCHLLIKRIGQRLHIMYRH